MATIEVTNTNDSGAGSLRQAVAQADATAGDDVIVFDASVFVPGSGARIELDSRLVITAGNNVTINGDTNGDGDIDVTISGGDFSEILAVAEGASVTLNAIGVIGGRAETSNAPITNRGELTITGSHFDGNESILRGSGALPGLGAAVIDNKSTGTLVISDSAFSRNAADGADAVPLSFGPGLNGTDVAGAILNSGLLSLARTLLSGNSASGGRGGEGASNIAGIGFDGGRGGHAAGTILNFGTVSGSIDGSNVATAGAGGAAGIGTFQSGSPGQQGTASNGLLNLDAGSGVFTKVNLGTMGTDVETISSGPFHGLGGDDNLTADAGGVSLFGGAGDDMLTSSFFGTTTLNGGLGNDIYEVFNASTVIQEGLNQGLETVRAAVSYVLADDDEIEELRTNFTGGTSAINLTGNSRQQDITGNNGNNILNGGVDNVEDVLFGLLGNDTYVLGGSLMDTVVDTGGTDTILSTITRDLNVHADIENLSLKGTGNINATGNALANKINGNIGKNDLIGNIGNDTLNGGDGNDRLKGGAGFDVMNGGKGVDLATFSDQTTRVIISLKETGTTTAFIKGVAADSLTAIENLNGGSGNDVFKGNSLANTFNGNAGNDNLNGGLGNDILTGGIGADKFRFTNVNFGRDRITDFSDNLDKLSFSTGVADSFRDFRITGNGSKSVTVTLGDDTITVQSTKVITLTASDFLFE